MRTRVVTIHSDALVWAAQDLMMRRKVRHLPVVDHGDRLVGIVTDRDLRQVIFDPAIQRRIGQRPRGLNALSVSDIMTRRVVTVGPTTDIREAARLMRTRKIGTVPVVEQKTVVGILSEADVLDALLRLVTRQPAPKVRGRSRRYEYGFPIRLVRDPWQDEGEVD